MEVLEDSIKFENFEDKYKRKKRSENKLLIKILALFSFFLLILLIIIYTNKKLRKEISKITVELKINEVIKDEYKKLKKFYQNSEKKII
jgi:hypothetical protein